MRAIASVIVWSVVFAGCGGPSTDTSSTPATFAEIYAALFPVATNPRCNFCHSMPASNASNGSLHTGNDQATAYAALVGKSSASSKCGGKTLVSPGNADQSLFFQKLSATPPCGDRMPVGGDSLTDSQLQMVRSWIQNGAKND